MAAGLGFKDFTTGEVLTANDVDGYLMQGVWVFASAAARDAAVTSPQEGNFAYLKDTNVTTYYTGSAWANLDTTGMTNPMTTTGDTIYSSSGSTPARLGIGSTGQVLTVASGIPSWATPAAGGGDFVKITSNTFSGASSVTVNDVFSATYNYYKLILSVTGSAGGYTQIRYRVSGSDATGTDYRFQRLYGQGSTVGTFNSASQTSVPISSSSETLYSVAEVLIANPFLATPTKTIVTNNYDIQSHIDFFTGTHGLSTSYTGFTMLPQSGTITGDYILYGLKA